MNWQVVVRPQTKDDILETADWYDSQRPGLGSEFISEILLVLDELAINPLLHARQHSTKNIRWRYSKRFPYRVIYEVIDEQKLVVVAVCFMQCVITAFGRVEFEVLLLSTGYGLPNRSRYSPDTKNDLTISARRKSPSNSFSLFSQKL